MDHPKIKIIRQRIRERLTVTGLSANAAGQLAGLGLSYANDILSGKSRNPVPNRLGMLAGALGCSPEWLSGEDDAPDDDRTAVQVAKAVEKDCRDFTHALAVARLALALCRAAQPDQVRF